MWAMLEKLRKCWVCSGSRALPKAGGITREAVTHNGEATLRRGGGGLRRQAKPDDNRYRSPTKIKTCPCLCLCLCPVWCPDSGLCSSSFRCPGPVLVDVLVTGSFLGDR